MKAYHNDSKLKESVLAEMAAERQSLQDFIIRAINQKAIIVNTTTGEVFSTRFSSPKKLGCKNSGGYIVNTLHIEGERKQVKQHQIIWLAKYGKFPSELVIDHINRNKTDNRIDNLRIVDAKINSQNRRSYCGTHNSAAKLNENDVKNIRIAISKGIRRIDIAKQYGVSRSLINAIAWRKVWN